ncbi:MAG TPA: DUF6364 family protein [Parafilimonas sp.]
MKTKLTLNIEESVVDKVKILSKKQRQSISALVENYLKSITVSTKKQTEKKGITFTEKFRKDFPITKSPSTTSDYKKEWHKHLDEKYGS